MTVTDIQNAIAFLSKVYVGRGDEDRLMKTINALHKELERKMKKKVETN